MEKNRKVEDYFGTKETSYFRLLITSKKWKEFFAEKESVIAFFVSVMFTFILYINFKSNLNNTANEFFKEISLNVAIPLIGLLGFTISGLAIFTGTITNKLVENIDNDQKGAHIINILYSFYFIGGIDALEIIILFLVHLLTYTTFEFCVELTYVIFLISSYLFFFILLYSVSLLGTCINLFLVGYKYYLDEKNKDHS